MSSQPDGTDARINHKEGETYYPVTTTRQSKHQPYHKADCSRLETMKGDPKEVDLAVANWKNMKPCAFCIGDRDDRGLSGPQVDRVRRAFVDSRTKATEIANGYNVHVRTVRYHARGERDYNYNTEPETPPVVYTNQEWVWSE